MKEIFDRRYPVTSFFLLVTTLVFIIMFLTSGFNYTVQQPCINSELYILLPSRPCLSKSGACSQQSLSTLACSTF